VAEGDVGRAMVSGEFVSMTAIHKTIPDSTPAPVAWGTYASNPNIHFFLCHFVDMIDEVPEIQAFVARVAELHTRGVSPNGKYGFPVPTYMGQMPQYTAWTDSWEAFFTVSMERLMLVIEETQGPDPEMKELLEKIVAKVIPRLLRPLETGGRQIVPRLIHGDLYSGNVSVHVGTGAPILYDATCLYAHNECKSQNKHSAYVR
jgi:protein-ribulosamine 3-kinase